MIRKASMSMLITVLAVTSIGVCSGYASYWIPFEKSEIRLQSLTDSSNSIYNVQVESVTDGRKVRMSVWDEGGSEMPLVEVNVTCKVFQTLKGKSHNRITFLTYRYDWPDGPIRGWSGPSFPIPIFRPGEQCLVFLNTTDHGKLITATTARSNRIFVSEGSWKSVPKGEPEEMVKATLLASLSDKNQWVTVDCIEALAQIKGSDVIQALIPLSNDKNELVAYAATLALVDLNHPPAVSTFVSWIKQNKKFSIEYPTMSGSKTVDVKFDAGHLNSLMDEAVVPYLAEILSVDDRSVYMAAGCGIRNAAGKNSIPILLDMLDSPYKDVRYYGATALNKVTGLKDFPSADKFYEQEDEYIEFWKDWADSREQ